MMILGALIGVIASVSGMYLSYFFNLPSGPAIVLVASGFFTLALLFSPSQGILTYSQGNFAGSALWQELISLIRAKN